MFSTRKWRSRTMIVLWLAAAGVFAAGVLAVVWLYHPWVRRPWLATREAQARAEAVARADGGRFPLERARVVVHKAARRLELLDGERVVKTYEVALGTNATDAKRKEGDGCTPEGRYVVCTKNERSRYHLFLGLSYPNEEDAARGLRAGLITKAQHEAIVAALEAGKRPLWHTRLGGEVGLHGGGAGSDWTRGCMALADKDVEELFLLLELGDEVVIEP